MKPLTILFIIIGIVLCITGGIEVYGSQNLFGLFLVLMGVFVWYLVYLTLGPDTSPDQAPEPKAPLDPIVYPNDDTMTKALRDAFVTPTETPYA